MAIQCAEAQTSTLAKLAPPHTAAHKLGHQLLNFCTGTSLWALTTLFLRSSGHFNTDPACRTGVLVRRLRTTFSCRSSIQGRTGFRYSRQGLRPQRQRSLHGLARDSTVNRLAFLLCRPAPVPCLASLLGPQTGRLVRCCPARCLPDRK